ncbi:MAG: hypothetical protein WC977_10025 [Anaerovoracaceae bacterium]
MTVIPMRRSGYYPWPPPPGVSEAQYPSVSMIVGLLDKSGALAGSAAKITAEYAYDEMDSWEGLPRDDAIKRIKSEYRRQWSAKAEIGSAAHHQIATWLATLDDGPPTIELDESLPLLSAAMAFVGDRVEKVGASEVTIWNHTYQYAGTADALVRLNTGEIAIVDWKTGRIYPETILQLTAYAHGETLLHDGVTKQMDQPITKLIAVHLNADGSYETQEADLPCGGKCAPHKHCAHFKAFTGLRSMRKWLDTAQQTAWTT